MRPDQVGKTLQALFLCDGRAGAAFGAIGAVEVVQLGLRLGGVQLRRKLLAQLALLRNAIFDLFAFFLQIAQGAEAFRQSTDDLIVQRAGHFLAIARDKGDGIALVQQTNGIFRLRCANPEFFLQFLQYIHDFLLFEKDLRPWDSVPHPAKGVTPLEPGMANAYPCVCKAKVEGKRPLGFAPTP